LNEIYRYKGEEFGEAAMNKFNIYPDLDSLLVDRVVTRNRRISCGTGRIDFALPWGT